MIRSMTGFARTESQTEHYAIRVEIRTVNNKTLRIVCRVADCLQGLERALEKMVRASLARGTVNLQIEVDDLSGVPGYALDEETLRHYYESYRRVAAALNTAADLSPRDLLDLPGVVQRIEAFDEMPEELGSLVPKVLQKALDDLVVVRRHEGEFIWQDILGRCKAIAESVGCVETRMPLMLEEYRRRLSDRLAVLLAGIDSTVTEEDVRRELALFADRSDISEEISRMRGHLELLRALEDSKAPCGRRLEFIAQEMFREANTMGSKCNDSGMIADILDIKAEIEKLREQAMNVE